jgi:hypothetical protein
MCFILLQVKTIKLHTPVKTLRVSSLGSKCCFDNSGTPNVMEREEAVVAVLINT